MYIDKEISNYILKMWMNIKGLLLFNSDTEMLELFKIIGSRIYDMWDNFMLHISIDLIVI